MEKILEVLRKLEEDESYEFTDEDLELMRYAD